MYQGSYSDCADCDMIIVTVGRSRKPGETRLDKTNKNVKILEGVAARIKDRQSFRLVLHYKENMDLVMLLFQCLLLLDRQVFSKEFERSGLL